MKLKNCHNCGSTKLDFSQGVMFGVVSIYCTKCGCKGASSETDGKIKCYETREKQAIIKWNKTLVEETAWPEYGGFKVYPPKKFKDTQE